MAKNVHLTDDHKALIAEEHAKLRATGMGARDADICIARKLDVSERSVRRYRGDPEALTSSDFEIGSTSDFIKGTSTLYDEHGNVKLKWVKTDNKFDAEKAREWIDELAKDLPQLAPTPLRPHHFSDTLTVIPMGDPHIGMYAWAEETGDDFDLDIATADLCGAVDRLVKSTPSSKECLIVNLGDFFHADNNSGETARGHNKLDTDTRWAKVLLAGLKAMRQCIASALDHHEKVTVINAIGNHDDHSSMFLTIALSNIYENEPRITIIDNPTITHYYEFGENLIGVHHGHTIKPDKLPLVMATDRPQEWGRCKYRLWLCGHLHQDIAREYQGVRVETFRTLAGRDAWASSMGYRSGRDMKAIILHKKWGEVARHVVSVDMLRGQSATQ
jgi:hypothetical protein